ncbi:MAG: TetR/AcrR family transcriptional regulator [Roseovarius sp.]|uniref:TetR/AcrR family transcriptional regulator n=1 Tax=Roseovarius sp. TaxID=1486281 RepID=UPI004059C9D5
MGRRASISRDTLLDATEAVVLEMGATRLTFDAVAERAGVSKGGLLYSFPTKEALMEGMEELLRLADAVESPNTTTNRE